MSPGTFAPFLPAHRRRSFSRLAALICLTLLAGCSTAVSSPNTQAEPVASTAPSPAPSPSPAISPSPEASKQKSVQPKTSKQPTKQSPAKPQAKKPSAPSSAAQNQKAVELNNQGTGKLSQGDDEGAVQDFSQAIKLNPKLAEAYLGRAIAYSMQSNHQAALKDYNQAIKLNPKFAEAYLNRGDEYAQVGNRQRAIADLRQAEKLFSQRGDKDNVRLAKNRIADLQEVASRPPAAETIAPPAQPSAPVAPEVAAQSPTMALAIHLKRTGAKMYGTYWCSSCQWQQQQFGEAFSQINYIECDPAGANARPDLCAQAGITAFPTWELNGQLYRPGAFNLERLAELSGYKGSRNFSG